MKKRIDSFDLKLIDLLQDHGNETTVWLAKKLGCTRHKVMNRMKQLEKQGVILSYMTFINYEALGGYNGAAILQVKPSIIKNANPIGASINHIVDNR